MFQEIQRTCPPLQRVLPRLREITWDAFHLGFLEMFLNPDVNTLTLYVPDSPQSIQNHIPGFISFLQTLPHASPRLRIFKIHGHLPLLTLSEPLSQCLLQLKHLTELSLPPSWHNDTIMASLSALPQLETISCLPHSQKSFGVISNLASLDTTAGFRALCHLHLQLNLSTTMSTFQLNILPQLKTLKIRSLNPSHPHDIQQLLQLCKIASPNLTMLSLALCPTTYSPTEDLIKKNIPMATLLPLLSLTRLTHFTLDYPKLSSISDADLGTITSKLTSLLEFSLIPRPIESFTPIITLSAFSHFHQNCPDIQLISLYFDGNRPIQPTEMYGATFRNLSVIDVGTSPLSPPNAKPIFLFLR
ncbi:hypothetical protein M422DRAFT_265578 [Sphaerobolus stellatus SS14]|uniref:Unplaced genomic scaffold SPHSTscaffold_150, whole genome shotgun sequence n=1 Tax=Sphaerobolus stellatus (strain SS14) TaxID=990650 RepID=A0A0C9UTJ7_SPHS4|nr:hypothetical protein M422DRAFT_265578 [Sphaerobolus stellatus SS14]